MKEVSFVRAVDGDTIVIEINGNEQKVRLIGVNTPESVHVDESKNNEYGEKASKYTKELLSKTQTLWLEYDEDRYDQYDRVLAYVWFTNSTENMRNMLNMKLVTAGYAEDVVYQPNDKYAKQFAEACDKAKSDGVGLWKYEEFLAAA